MYALIHKDHYGAKENNVPHLGTVVNDKIWLIYPYLCQFSSDRCKILELLGQ